MSSLPVPTVLTASTGANPASDPTSETTLFSRERQTVFLGALAATGSVRSASARAGVSQQTAYRARLSSPGFRRGWDAALLAARAQAEEVLGCRALDGWEEDVIYHGEVVATRRRYSDRLLLAHLGRLDRLCDDAEVAQLADQFDDRLMRFGAGEDRPARVAETAVAGASGEGANCSPGPWSMWSTPGGEGAAGPRIRSGVRGEGDDDSLDGEEVVPPLPLVRRARGPWCARRSSLRSGSIVTGGMTSTSAG